MKTVNDMLKEHPPVTKFWEVNYIYDYDVSNPEDELTHSVYAKYIEKYSNERKFFPNVGFCYRCKNNKIHIIFDGYTLDCVLWLIFDPKKLVKTLYKIPNCQTKVPIHIFNRNVHELSLANYVVP
jgi:hypothetical protein